MDVLIVGAGAVGLSLAWELSSRGASVSILERDEVGRGTSWAGAGILPPPSRVTHDPLENLRSFSHSLHETWAQTLLGLTGIDNGFRRCGGVYLATSPGETAALTAQAYQWEADGIAVQRLDQHELLEVEPALQSAVVNGLIQYGYYLADECQIRNPRHLQALEAACRAAGVRIHEHQPVTEIEAAQGQVRRVKTADRVYQADKVCLCGGAWSNPWLQAWGHTSSIYPVRGQIILYRAEQALGRRVMNEGHRYLVPREDGYLLVGSSEEEVGFQAGTTDEVIGGLRDWSLSLMPQLANVAIEKTWSGFRPATMDGLPYLGKFPELDNLYLAAGHYRSGLHLSPGTAICMADVLEGRPPPLPLDAFRITRGHTALSGQRFPNPLN